jgi:hypothetical protein
LIGSTSTGGSLLVANSEPKSTSRTHSKDTSRPVGDACRDDGTLKDASEMEWLNLPSDEQTFVVPEKGKRKSSDYDEDEDLSLEAKVKHDF